MAIFQLPELVENIISHLNDPPDLLRCACVNKLWNPLALERLYEGSMIDMRYRTPALGFLNSLLTASRERFAQCMGYVEHLILLPEKVAIDGHANTEGRAACFEVCRAFRNDDDAKLLLQAKGKGELVLSWYLICL